MHQSSLLFHNPLLCIIICPYSTHTGSAYSVQRTVPMEDKDKGASVLYRTYRLMIIKIGSIRKETWTCKLWEKGQSQQRDQRELTEPECVCSGESKWCIWLENTVQDEEAKWSRINLWKELTWGQETAISFHKQFLTPSWRLCFLLVPRVLFAKGGESTQKTWSIHSISLLCSFYLEKFSRQYLIMMDNFRIKGTNCGSTPTQWVN